MVCIPLAVHPTHIQVTMFAARAFAPIVRRQAASSTVSRYDGTSGRVPRRRDEIHKILAELTLEQRRYATAGGAPGAPGGSVPPNRGPAGAPGGGPTPGSPKKDSE